MEVAPNGHENAADEMKKGPWTRDEDQKLLDFIRNHGYESWRALPAKAGLKRCGKSCRLRWTNYLRPDIKRGKFTTHEEKAIIRLHALLGNKWSAIATHLPNRTDNEIKNYWNTRLKKRLVRMGIDPLTHKPTPGPDGWAQSSQHAATINHMTQWEKTRLEAEARLVRESKRQSNLQLQLLRKAAAPPPPPCLDVLKVWQGTVMANMNQLLAPAASALGPPTSDDLLDICNIVSDSSTMMLDSMLNQHKQMENPMEDYCYYDATCLMDVTPINYGNVIHNDSVFDSRSYWSDVLNLVVSPMESSPVF